MDELRYDVVSSMLSNFPAKTKKDRINSLRQVIQEIILYGLSKADFFDIAAFYGGTALRIFHGLDRFSEDLDFSLLNKDMSFSFNSYWEAIHAVLKAYGINFSEEKDEGVKDNTYTVYAKANLRELLHTFFPDNLKEGTAANEKLTIKINVNVNPPHGGMYEYKTRVRPAMYSVRLFDMPSLFASKISAILTRNFKNNEKGRDFYDYLFYIGRNTDINMDFLKNSVSAPEKTKYNEAVRNSPDFTWGFLLKLLEERFSEIKFEIAKNDMSGFIDDISVLDSWNEENFKSITRDYFELNKDKYESY
ncbi:MAG: nucleotidyl transferase AbiEii/AbiGii toxin family protein [Clostridia bacterium]|nr:nucleotidyl transferase AbiEii/AbiGii toxin family protein [Clostridia bacterium]